MSHPALRVQDQKFESTEEETLKPTASKDSNTRYQEHDQSYEKQRLSGAQIGSQVQSGELSMSEDEESDSSS